MKHQFENLGAFLSNVANAAHGNPHAIERIAPYAAAAGANEQFGTDGGFVVQSDFAGRLWERATQVGKLLAACERQPITVGNGIKIPAIDERSRADGSRFGGLQIALPNESDTVTATKAKFRSIELRLNKYMGIGYATDELYADSPALESFIERSFSAEAVLAIEEDFITGSGSAGHALGILNSGATITVAAEGGQSTATVVAANVTKMYARMWPASRPNAMWLVNAEAEPQLYGLTLASGAPLFTFEDGGPRLMGLPVVAHESCKVTGTLGDLILVDPSQYLVGEKSPQFLSSIHVRFLNDENTFRFTYRVAGSPAWATPITPKNGTNTVSPFITLAARP